MNNSENFDIPRGQWMSTEGRDVFHRWIATAIDLHRAAPYDFSRVKFNHKRPTWNVEDVVELNLRDFGRLMCNGLLRPSIDEKDSWRDLILSGHSNAIVQYTSADTFIEMRPQLYPDYPLAKKIGIRALMGDGMDFATQVTVGMAYEAHRETASVITNNHTFYSHVAEVLRNPTFHQVLEELSTTGFSFLSDNFKHAMLKTETIPHVVGMLHVDRKIDRLIIATPTDIEGNYTYSLHPEISEALKREMCQQNKTHKINGGSMRGAIATQLAKRSFTSGCPVRKAPESATLEGGGKSGIALLSEYLGERLQEMADVRFKDAPVQALAQQAVSATQAY